MANAEISIRPGVGMLGLFPHMKYQPWYALGELVDNSIQSYITHKAALERSEPGFQLRVSIDIGRADAGVITVRDNAGGIDQTDWERAFKVAEPPEDASGLSQFGVGMKAACCWFARSWSVRTSCAGDPVMRSVSFDVPKIVRSGDETLDVIEEPTSIASHFTVIDMTELHRIVQARTLGKIKTYLGGIYRLFLRTGELDLRVNDEPIRYVEPTILVARRYNDPDGEPRRWCKEVNIKLSSGRRVTGFVAIRETGDARQAGLTLFYRRKAVTGSGEDAYKPTDIYGSGNSFQSQRLFGELNMDDFSVTYTKDALVWHDEEDEFVDLLRRQIDAEPLPLIKQARDYRKRDPEPAPRAAAKRVVDGTIESFAAAGTSVSPRTEAGPSGAAQPDALGGGTSDTAAPSDDLDSRVELDLYGHRWTVDMKLAVDDSIADWLTVKVQEDGGLSLTVNRAHPFMRAFCELPAQELEPVWRIAIALGLAQEIARAEGATMPTLVTQNVNRLLRTVLSHQT